MISCAKNAGRSREVYNACSGCALSIEEIIHQFEAIVGF
jgi:hypothetical protein